MYLHGGVSAGAEATIRRYGAETVRVGYFTEPQPFVAGIAREWFDTADDDFAFFNQPSGSLARAKLDQGDLDIAFLGSYPFAVGAARGVAATAFYVQYVIGDSEALVMRRDGVESPLDLEGKTVAVPFDSTAHYHLAYTATLNPSVNFTMVNLEDKEIIERYDALAIDGAFIWEAGADAKNHILDNSGFQLLSSGLYETWGKPTSMVCVASRRFLERRPDLVERFAGVYGRLDAAWNCCCVACARRGGAGSWKRHAGSTAKAECCAQYVLSTSFSTMPTPSDADLDSEQ